MTRDYAVVLISDDFIWHRADCKMVRQLADTGTPVMTLLGCEHKLPQDAMCHDCLKNERADDSEP